jgi:hypothetical protein
VVELWKFGGVFAASMYRGSSVLFYSGTLPFCCRTEGSFICITSTTAYCCYRFDFLYSCRFVFQAVGTCAALCGGKEAVFILYSHSDDP